MGNRLADAEPASGKGVDIFAVKRFQRGLSAELLHSLISDAVADHKHILHLDASGFLPLKEHFGLLYLNFPDEAMLLPRSTVHHEQKRNIDCYRRIRIRTEDV